MDKDNLKEITADIIKSTYASWKTSAKSLEQAQNARGGKSRISDGSGLQQVQKQFQTVRESAGGSSRQEGAGSRTPDSKGAPKRKRTGLRWLVALLVVTVVAAALSVGYFKYHIWSDATCDLPQICKICGVEGAPALGHDWQEATLSAPMTCGRCSVSQGNPVPKSVSLTVSRDHAFVLRADGSVVVTGSGAFGQDAASQWSDICMIRAGQSHVVGLRVDGTVVAAGSSGNGRTAVDTWNNVVSLATGDAHTVALGADGTVLATGYNLEGQCDVSHWNDIVALSAGASHTVGLRADGTVVATGSNGSGQCDVSHWTDVVAVQAAANRTVGLRADGTVVTAGVGTDNLFGTEAWTEIRSISVSPSHTVGIRADGTAVAVGSNDWGQCDLADWYDLVSIEAGKGYTAGLRADGTVLFSGNGDSAMDFSHWDGGVSPLWEKFSPGSQAETSGSRYTIHVRNCTWEEAGDYARQLGGSLLRIDNPQELSQVLELIESLGYQKFYFFLNARREPGSSDYYWINDNLETMGSPLNDARHWACGLWFEGEPSLECDGRQEYYLEMHYDSLSGWGWNDVVSDPGQEVGVPVAFIVEYDG